MIRWLRSISRDSRAHLLVAAASFGFAVAMAVSSGAAQQQRAQEQAAHQVANYGLWYALTQEQAKAGRFESQRNDTQTALDNTQAYVGGLRETIGKLRQQLKQKAQRIEQVESPSWTGQVRAKSRDSE